jgi:integrase/recombinase XerD
LKNYQFIFTQFQIEFGYREPESITPDEILSFLTKLTDGTKQTTKRNRYSSLKAFFNFIKNSIDPNFQNPCDTPILRKIFKDRKPPPWPIIEKELIDEIIFKTVNPRNRIMLELMARGGMRVGEVLKIRSIDIQDHKITLAEPKSGKESEVVFIPQKVADRLKDYVRDNKIELEQRIFPITYNAARIMVQKAGKMVGIHLRPHDLRRFCATYASRAGTPIEIVSKVILRHSHLSTTQRYLGKISDTEALKWIENLYG